MESAAASARRMRRWLDGSADNMAVWSNAQRKRYFPNPVPDTFYTGNATVEYVRAFLPADENGSRKNGAVASSYELHPR